ncbi:unnamed protein product [Wuchereria bancrofti]|uniref:ZP domain-containing protein n=1 Tax=Wuchereria bancrofti TaxID=6293 RepID=A0A3P7ECA0_WUCBA|nr:unnamed protein product [Wuchereria bancrofti]
MAGQEAHVYKYADRSELFYQCQISITIKEPNSECPRPQCSEPEGFGATQRQTARKRRDTNAWYDSANTLDVRTEMTALEIMDETVSKTNIVN